MWNRQLEDSVRGVQAKLTLALHRYNSYRTHFALKGITLMQYLQNTLHMEV